MAKSTGTPDLRLVLGIDLARLKKDFDAAVAMARSQGKIIGDALSGAVKLNADGVKRDLDEITKRLAEAALKAQTGRSPVRGGGGTAPPAAPPPPPPASAPPPPPRAPKGEPPAPDPEEEARRRAAASERAARAIEEVERRHAAINEQISKQSTDALIDDILRLRERKKALQAAMLAETDKAAKAELASQTKAIKEELGLRTAAAGQRKEVVEDGAGVRAGILGKKRNVEGVGGGSAFDLNQSVEAVSNVASAIDQLSAPLVKLDEATAKMRAIGPEAAKMSEGLKDAALGTMREIPFEAADIMEAYNGAIAAGVKGGEESIATFGESAGKLATVSSSEIGTAGDVLSGVLNSYGLDASNADKVSDQLWNTINAGVLSMDEMKASFANVLPTASAMNLSFDSLGGAMAGLTQKNIPFAQATTKLNALLLEVQKPGTALAPILAKAGVTAADLAKDMPGSLEKIQGALTATGTTAVQAFSSSEASAAFNVFASDIDGLRKSIADVGGEEGVGTVDKSYGEMADSISVRTKLMLNTVQSFITEGLDKLGGGFVAASSAAAQLAPMVTTFTQLKGVLPVGDVLNFAKGLLGSVIPALSSTAVAETAAGAAGSKMWLAITGPIGLVIAGIAAAIAVFVLLYKNSEKFRDAVDKLTKKVTDFGDRLWKAVKPAIDAIGDAFGYLVDILGEVGGVYLDLVILQFEIFIDIISAAAGAISDAIDWLFELVGIGDPVSYTLNSINKAVGFVKQGIEAFKTALAAVKGGVIAFANEVGGALGELFTFDFEALFARIKSAGDRVKRGAEDAVRIRNNDAIRDKDVAKWRKYADDTIAIVKKAASDGDEALIKANRDKAAKFFSDLQADFTRLNVPLNDARRGAAADLQRELEAEFQAGLQAIRDNAPPPPPPPNVPPPKPPKKKDIKDLTDELNQQLDDNLRLDRELTLAVGGESVAASLAAVGNEIDDAVKEIQDRIDKLNTDEFKGAKNLAELIAALEASKLLKREEIATKALDIIDAAGAEEATKYAERFTTREEQEIAFLDRRLALVKERTPNDLGEIGDLERQILERNQALQIKQFIDGTAQFKALSQTLFDAFAAGAINQTQLDTGLDAIRARIRTLGLPELELLLDEHSNAWDKFHREQDARANGDGATKNALATENGFVKAAMAFREGLMDAFRKKEDAARKEELRKKKDDLDKELGDLRRAYLGGKIKTLEEYYDKAADLRAKQAEFEKENAVEAFDLQKTVNEALAKALGASQGKLAEHTQKASEQVALGTSNVWSLLAAAGTQFTAILAQTAVEQGNVAEAAGKAAIGIAFDVLQAMIPIWSAQILGLKLSTGATFGPIGTAAALAEWTLLTALLTGVVGAARAATGFRDGVVDLAGPGTTTSDSIPARLSRRESVLNAGATTADGNAEAFRWANRTRRPLVEFYRPQLSASFVDAATGRVVMSEIAALNARVAAMESSPIPDTLLRDNELARKYLHDIRNAVTATPPPTQSRSGGGVTRSRFA